jgi:hypothetical protein
LNDNGGGGVMFGHAVVLPTVAAGHGQVADAVLDRGGRQPFPFFDRVGFADIGQRDIGRPWYAQNIWASSWAAFLPFFSSRQRSVT